MTEIQEKRIIELKNLIHSIDKVRLFLVKESNALANIKILEQMRENLNGY